MKQLVLALKEEFDELKKWSVSFWYFSEQGAIEEAQKDVSLDQFKEWLSEKQQDGVFQFELILLLPAWRSQFHQFELQKGQSRHLSKVAPFLLESHIAQPIEDTHFVTLALKQGYKIASNDVVENEALDTQEANTHIDIVHSFAVASIVSKDAMNEWLTLFKDVNPARTSFILPQAWLCNQLESSEFCVFNDDVYTWSDGQLIQVPPEFVTANIQERVLQSDPDTDAEFVAYQLSNRKNWQSMDLRSGEFGEQSAVLHTLWSWKWLALAASLLFVVSLYSMQSDTERLNQQAVTVNEQSKDAFLRLAPDEGRVVNLSRQLKAKLRQTNEAFSGSVVARSPYEVLNTIDQARQTVKGSHSIVSVNYRNGSYRIQWRAKNRDVFDSLLAAFNKQGLDVQLDQVLKRGAEFIGAFQLQGESK
ncbi:type II secretion system protein GspL [Marinomonas mediterranea]|uniref:type II secretion system protein GspL n=1 Tax=Marinomonas mediterranea TaxID=119864 RepID=UPI00234A7A25|nr:type II secretion system protein GspL [Marinomonas mediterranea]WCN08329.1 hypothetical protein GV055_05060 [Marinomonas mediterranea]